MCQRDKKCGPYSRLTPGIKSTYLLIYLIYELITILWADFVCAAVRAE